MSPLSLEQFRLRRFLTACCIVFVVVAVAGYSLFQARFLLIGPQLTLEHTPTILQDSRVVTLTGVAHNITFLSLNGREIYTDKNGYFKEALVLENGYTVATLSAQDRYGRAKDYEQTFVYTPATQQGTN